MSTYAIKADKFFLPAGPQLGGYLMVEDGVFGAWQADEPSCEIKDYTGSWIAPGMVDTHIHAVGLGVSGVLPTRTELSRLMAWANITNGRAR